MKLFGSAATLVALAIWPIPATGQGFQERGIRVVSDEVLPSVIEAGAVAVRRITLETPAGARLSFPEALPTGSDTEPSRTVQRHRIPLEDGLRWVLSYPFTAWSVGTATTETLVVEVSGAGGSTTLTLPGPRVTVRSPLPAARIIRTAAAEPPWPVPVPREAYLPLLPLILAVTSAVLWWRSAPRRDAAEPILLPASAPAERPSLREVLEAPPAEGGELAVAVSAALRRHPALVGSGVRAWHTTPEIRTLLAGVGAGQAMETGVLDLLALGDRVAYGGRTAAEDEVRTLGWTVLEALEDD